MLVTLPISSLITILIVQNPAELAAATGEFAQSASDLSSSDVGTQLAQCLAALAEVGRKSQDVQATQSEQDVVTLLSTVDEYARLINSVRVSIATISPSMPVRLNDLHVCSSRSIPEYVPTMHGGPLTVISYE